MSVKFISKANEFIDLTDKAADQYLAYIATNIERLAKMVVPHDTGKLQNSIRTEKKANKHWIVDVGVFPFNIPYARKWEFTTPAGGFKKPGRKSGYLRDSAKKVISESDKYLKRALGKIKV